MIICILKVVELEDVVFLKWFVFFQVAEEINSDDEFYRDIILNFLLFVVIIDKVLEKVNVDYENEF